MAKASRPWILFLVIVVGIVAGALMTMDGKPGFSLLAAIVVVSAAALIALALGCLYVLALFSSVAFHELGHYVAGRCVGFRFMNFVAGPIGFRAEGKRLVAYRIRPARFNGYVSMMPSEEGDFLRKYFFFILGGPLASLVWLGTVLAVWQISGLPLIFALPHRVDLPTLIFSVVLSIFLLGAVLMLPGTLLPYRIKGMGGLPTDMMWLLMLPKGGPLVRRLVALTTLHRMLLEGVECRNLPFSLIEEANGQEDGTVGDLSALTFRWAHGIHHDPEAARQAIERHASLVGKLGDSLLEPWRTAARLTQSANAIFIARDVVSAKAWIDGLQSTIPNFVAAKATAEAGIAAFDNSPDLGLKITQAEAAIVAAEKLDRLSWRWERERLEEIRAGWPGPPVLADRAVAKGC